jgi:polyamine oxidase
LTYNETGYTDYSEILDEYDESWTKASVKAGRMLADNIQDETARAGLAMAGWNPKHSDMKRQAVEWWNWGTWRIVVSQRKPSKKTNSLL